MFVLFQQMNKLISYVAFYAGPIHNGFLMMLQRGLRCNSVIRIEVEGIQVAPGRYGEMGAELCLCCGV